MTHTSSFPILLDGRNVNGFRVQELKAALISFGVPESEHTKTQLKLGQAPPVFGVTGQDLSPGQVVPLLTTATTAALPYQLLYLLQPRQSSLLSRR